MPKKRGANEIQIARGRLKGALQDLVTHSSEESDNEEQKKSTPANEPVPVEPVSTSKGRITRRSKIDDDSSTSNINPNKEKVFESFVMKLFDRSLDLANYKETTPLYPICRAWMNNTPKAPARPKIEQPEKRMKSETEVVQSVQTKIIDHITTLPLPKHTEISKIPEREKDEKDYKNIIDLDYDLDHPPFTKEELLTDHKKRWKQFKTNWTSHNKHYQKQKYSINFAILDIVLKTSDK